MKLTEAKEECERWLSHLQKKKHKVEKLQELAKRRKDGLCSLDQAKKELAVIDANGPMVYDGAKLEIAVKVLLKELK